MTRCLKYCLVFCVYVLVQGNVYAQEPCAVDIEKYTRTVRSGDLSFPVVDYGKGPVVLMIHGFPDSRHVWRYQIKALGDAGFRVLAPDLRGLGDAPKFAEPEKYGVRTHGNDMIGILDTLGVKKVQLVAHDWGAVIGWRLTADYPDRIERYVAMSIAAPGHRLSIRAREKRWYMAFFRQVGTAEEELMADDWRLFREWERAKGKKEIEWDIKFLSRPGALTAALTSTYRPAEPPLPPAAPVSVPVLGIWSDGDAYIEEDGFLTAGERLKGPYRYERINGASHWMQLDRPHEINRLLLEFLQK